MSDDKQGVESTANGGTLGNGGASPDGALAGRLAGLKVKRGRGRPPGSGKTSRVAMETPSRNVSSVSDEDTKRDCIFFVETAISLAQVGDGFLKEVLLQRLKSYGVESSRVEEFRKSLLEPASLGPREIEILRAQLTALALKYDILRKIGPEIGLVIFLAQYALRQWRVYRFVEQMKPTRKPTSPQPPVADAS